MTGDQHPLDKRDEPAPEPKLDRPKKSESRLDRELDEALKETFPASDPPMPSQPTSTEPAGDPTAKP